MKFLVVLSLTVVAMLQNQVEGKVSTTSVTRASNAFANELYQQVAKKPGNILVCPVSLHVALALLHQGAGGNTARQLVRTLRLTGSKDDIKNSYRTLLNSMQDNTLKVVTKLYPADDVKLNQTYVSDAKQYFLSGVETLDFKNPNEAANKINTFVEKATNDKIHNLISPDSLDDLTRLVVINAVHFQASWKKIFVETEDHAFHVNSRQYVMTKMMSQMDYFGYKEDRELDAKILEMNYDVEGYSMIFVLPNKVEGLTELEAKLQNTSLASLMEGLDHSNVIVTIPKFTIEETIDLSGILKQMGLTEMFAAGRADLHNLAEGEQLFVKKVVQKTFINVHEKGTEAAASTGFLAVPFSSSEDFRANRPFMFLLVSRSQGLVLFMGRFSAPESRSQS